MWFSSFTISAPPPAPLQIDIDFVNFNTIQHENFEFNINGSDVMVFLHVQKTGGTTFGKHLVQDIDLESPCLCKRRRKSKKRKFHHSHEDFDVKRDKRKLKCDCFRPTSKTNWLFSRYVTKISCIMNVVRNFNWLISRGWFPSPWTNSNGFPELHNFWNQWVPLN